MKGKDAAAFILGMPVHSESGESDGYGDGKSSKHHECDLGADDFNQLGQDGFVTKHGPNGKTYTIKIHAHEHKTVLAQHPTMHEATRARSTSRLQI